jgi:uncharacterized Ntn-hydrolase superfamily protein
MLSIHLRRSVIASVTTNAGGGLGARHPAPLAGKRTLPRRNAVRSTKRIGLVLLVGVFSLVSGAVAMDASTGTFSIVALDSLTGEMGVAVQSKAFGVGAAVAWAEAGAGAIATQASTNMSFGPRGLELLGAGLSSEQALEILLAGDEGREDRQVGVIDTRGRAVNFTGARCLDWAGGVTGPGYACQGNILASEAVVAAMADAFEGTGGELADRLLAALVAAQAAGGDKRGMQSAALLVVRPSARYPEYRHRYVDLRVEDHEDPINELIRLYEICRKSDLLQAHIRYADMYDAEGEMGMADRERRMVGEMLAEALEQEAEDADYLNNLAWFCATGDVFLDEALEAAKRAVALEPEAAYILDTLAEVYFRLGNTEDAITTIERAIEIDPESAYYKEQLDRFEAGL